MVLPLTQLFFGLTTTVSASKATGSSMYLMPFLRQSSISSARMGREAFDHVDLAAAELLEATARARHATVTRTLPRLEIWNSSANASETGNTVLEPSILIAACASARSAAATDTTPTISAGTRTFCRKLHGLEPLRLIGVGKARSDGQGL